MREDAVREFVDPTDPPHFVRKADMFVGLTDDERASMTVHLDKVAVAPANTLLQRSGDPVERILILVSGAMVETSLGRDGRAQNFRFFFPGDSVGSNEISAHHHAHDVRALTPVRYAAVPKSAAPIDGSTRMGRLFFAVRLAEQAILNDRLRVIGRERAEHRVLHLMLELHARQRLTHPGIGNHVWRPFSQAEIGDALGLTNVYVSKTLTKLRQEGTIALDGNVVTLNDPAEIAHRIGFMDHYGNIDIAHVRGGAPVALAAE